MLYRFLRWPMDPGDPEAVERFEAIVGFFVERLGGEVPLYDDAVILDVAGGTGIASLALAEALARKGARAVRVTVTDIREEDLGKARIWLERRGLRGVELELVRADGRRLVERVWGGYDYILLWGSSLPHFSTWDYALIVANTRELIRETGVFMVEQKNLLPAVLHSNAYKQVYIAPGKARGQLIAAVLTGYDEVTGMDIKQQYLLPGFQYLGETRSRLWDLATALTIAWLFYENVRLVKTREQRVADVIVASKPRRDAPSARSLLDTYSIADS